MPSTMRTATEAQRLEQRISALLLKVAELEKNVARLTSDNRVVRALPTVRHTSRDASAHR